MNTKSLLAPLSGIYGTVISARRTLYKKGFFTSYDLGVPVISVGNITVGGTGKTPLVAHVAKILAENGHSVCILTRGYKRQNPNSRVLVSDGKRILADAKTSGDEPFVLAQQLLNIAAVIADKNRVKAGIWARENLGVTAFVLDDGFQHLRLKRSLDIVTIDATNPFGNGKLLPAGTLRENTISLKRADCIVITRADLSTEIENLKSQISTYNANCPIFLANTRIVDLKPLAEYLEQLSIETRQAEARIQNLKSQSVFAFCALGNPNGFFDHLHHSGFNLLAAKRFPDHYAYTQKDIESLENSAQEKGINILLTTAKDAVKLSALKLNLPYFVVEIEIEFDDEKHLNELLQAIRLQNKV